MTIDKELVEELLKKAAVSSRLRMNLDLREDGENKS